MQRSKEKADKEKEAKRKRIKRNTTPKRFTTYTTLHCACVRTEDVFGVVFFINSLFTMSIHEILSSKKSAKDLYSQLRGTTLEAASAEPLKLAALRKREGVSAPSQSLPSGLVVSYAGALCYYCLQALMSKYSRKSMPDESALVYMAKQMSTRFATWSVLDLPTFVDMCLCSRIPSLYNGGMEYQLVTLDIPNIMGKVEAYDRMRPGKMVVQEGSQKTCREREWDSEKEHKLFDGTPHEFASVEEAKRYWKSEPNYDNPDEKKHALSILASKQGVCKKVS